MKNTNDGHAVQDPDLLVVDGGEPAPEAGQSPTGDAGCPARGRRRSSRSPSSQPLLTSGCTGRRRARRSRLRSGGSWASSSRASPRSGRGATLRPHVRLPSVERSAVAAGEALVRRIGEVGQVRCGVPPPRCRRSRGTRCTGPPVRQRVHEQVHPLARRADRSASTRRQLLVRRPTPASRSATARRRATSSCACWSPQNSAHCPKYVPGSSACIRMWFVAVGDHVLLAGQLRRSRTSGSPRSRSGRWWRRRSARRPTRA